MASVNTTCGTDNVTCDYTFTAGPNEAISVTLGVVLLLCCFFGVPANAMSLSYFYTLKVHAGSNGLFFKRVYTTITSVDCLICALQLPSIHQLLHNERFSEEYETLCRVWVVGNETLLATSISLVAVLSVSRSLVLALPHKKLSISAAWLIPGGVAATVAAVEVLYFTVELSPPAWRLLVAVLALITVLPVFTVSISFIFSLVYLRRARHLAQHSNGSTAEHEAATITVIAVSLLYVVCNIPVSLGVVYHVLVTLGQQEARLYHQFIEKYYVEWLVMGLLPAINSALNPLVYFWRMRCFRRYFAGRSGAIRIRGAAGRIRAEKIKMRLSNTASVNSEPGYGLTSTV